MVKQKKWGAIIEKNGVAGKTQSFLPSHYA